MFEPSRAVQRINAFSQRPAQRPGPGMISLSSGDPDFETPPHIRQALAEAVEAGYTHYANNNGDPELRRALAEQNSKIARQQYSADEILMTHGGSGAIASAILGVVNPGDRVLLPEPTYSSYADVILLAGAEPVFVRQTEDYHLDFDALRAAAPGARMLILCHPTNPTGVVYRRDELEALGELAQQFGLLVMSDEAYDHIVFDGVEYVSTREVESLQRSLIYCQTFSKTYAMTGWRLGYLMADKPIIDAAARVHRTFNSALNASVQRAALVAVTTPTDWPERMRLEYQARRELVLELLDGAPGLTLRPPDGTFYAFIKLDPVLSAPAVVAGVHEQGVAVRVGSEYGPSGEGHIRITFATGRKNLTEGLLRLRSVVGSMVSESTMRLR